MKEDFSVPAKHCKNRRKVLVEEILRGYLVRAVGNRVRKAPVQREQLGRSLWFEELSVVHEQVQESLGMDMA